MTNKNIVEVLSRNNPTCPHIAGQCGGDTHEENCEIAGTFMHETELRDNLKIDGESLEDVLSRSVILGMA